MSLWPPPGVGFNEEGEGYVRLALVERLRQAVRQMKRALQEIDQDMNL